MPAPLLIDTPRLQLVATHPGLAEAVVAYQLRNAAHFAPWDPPLPADHATPAQTTLSLLDGQAAFEAGLAHRWWLCLREAHGAMRHAASTLHLTSPALPEPLRRWADEFADPAGGLTVIGSINLSNLARGPFQSCNLGYALDATFQGFGLMHEALRAVVNEAFAPAINLHRIQAAVRPNNLRSLAVLQRLGFREEGLARDYLYIDGAWRDHRLFALTNPGFTPPVHWLTKEPE